MHYALFRKLLLAFCLCQLSSAAIFAQTPIANRVRGMEKSLPKEAFVIARYTDDRRHCLYYKIGDRLFKYDVLDGIKTDLTISPSGYTRIINIWINDNHRYLIVAIDRRGLTETYLENGQELWRIDTYSGRRMKIGTGYKIALRGEKPWLKQSHYIISKASRCLNPKEPMKERNWMIRDHYFDMEGLPITITDEYRYGTSPAPYPTEENVNVKFK
ncbi:MAG: hypothetical protein IJM81_00515 [Prevotella sp.]|nr:hypothetical protein [Prevotella sp.]